jgi:hypothetical protein
MEETIPMGKVYTGIENQRIKDKEEPQGCAADPLQTTGHGYAML